MDKSTVTANVRFAVLADVTSLVALLQQLFSLEFDFAGDPEKQRHGLRLLLGNPQAIVVVVTVGKQVLGMCSGQLLISTAEGGYSVLVEDVVVLPEWRGKGIGRALLAAVADWAEERGATRLQLLADRNNAHAFGFYRQLGWQTTELVCLMRQDLSGR